MKLYLASNWKGLLSPIMLYVFIDRVAPMQGFWWRFITYMLLFCGVMLMAAQVAEDKLAVEREKGRG